MLRLTGSLALLALAHMGRAQWCSMDSLTNVGGYNLPECELTSKLNNVFKVNLSIPSLVKYVSLNVRNPTVKAPVNFTVTVDGKFCGQIDEYSDEEIFQITCANGGISGSVVEWKTENPIPNQFEFCNFNVCGNPTDPHYGSVPLIDLHGQPSSQSSTWDSDTVASKAYDDNPNTCASNLIGETNQPWWTVDMGDVYTVYFLKITNTYENDFKRLGNVVVTVDGKPCGPKQVQADWLYVWIMCTEQPTGQYLTIKLEDAPIVGILTLCEVDIYGVSRAVGSQVNLHGHSAKQSQNWTPESKASDAIDGNPKSCSKAWYKNNKEPEWWSVDLGAQVTVDYIEITTAPGAANELSDVFVTVDGKNCSPYLRSAAFNSTQTRIYCAEHPTGTELKIQRYGAPDFDKLLSLCDVKVFGMSHESTEAPHKINLTGDMAKQSSDWSVNTVASMAIDGNPDTYTNTANGKAIDPWWTVDMGRLITVHYIEITNRPGLLYRLGNVVITVDGFPCGGILLNADQLHVQINCTTPATGQVLKIQLENAPDRGILTLNEVEVFGTEGYALTHQPEVPKVKLLGDLATQSSDYSPAYGASNAIDGNPATFTSTEEVGMYPWWTVDMGGPVLVHYVEITNRPGYMERLRNVVVTVDGKPCGPKLVNGNELHVRITCTEPPTGQILKIELSPSPVIGVLTLAEVDIFGYNLVVTNQPEVPKQPEHSHEALRT